MLFGRCFHLCAIAVTDPYFCLLSPHDFPDDIHTAVKIDLMQHSFGRTKHPLPPGLPTHPVAGLIRMNHGTLLDGLLDGFELCKCLVSSALHDLVDPALANLNAMQVVHGSLG